MKATETALQASTSSDTSFITNDHELSSLSINIVNRAKKRVLDHVRNGTDIILVTSVNHVKEPISLESYFSDSNDEIRTLSLSNLSFESQANESSIDLSMISAVVYESIHLDTHFAIIVDNADQIPLQALNELIQLALGINTSKNNVNFIFSGGPNLLSTIQQISDITRLSLAHCSVDIITEEDVQDFISYKQENANKSSKLVFNKFVLKKICTLANGSIYQASIILEWLRLYALHTNKLKITVSLLDELSDALSDTNLFASYPPVDYQFSTEIKYDTEAESENVEFVQSESLTEHQNHLTNESKTIYIEKDQSQSNSETPSSNVYEKVMLESDGNDNENVSHENTLNEENTQNDIEIEAVATSIDSSEVIDKISLSDSGLEYTDTYQLEALKEINEPMSFDNDINSFEENEISPVNRRATTNNFQITRFFVYLILLALIAAASLYAWSTNIIDKSLFNSIFSQSYFQPSSYNRPAFESKEEQALVIGTQPNSINTENQLDKAVDALNVEALIELANRQIQDKKLTTPEGDNAYETFMHVLAVEPRNKLAQAGIDKIKNRYAAWAKLDIKDGNIKRARYFLTLALDIDPNDREIKRTLSGINQPTALAN